MNDELPVTMEDEPVITLERVFDYIRNLLAGIGVLVVLSIIGYWSVK